MGIDKNILDESQMSYEFVNTIKEHAKKYDFVTDKKEFLKKVSVYEQKLILLNSKNPYEVLQYLEEIDLKNLNIILNNLDYLEITSIIQQFSSEDKKNFYERFSYLELVNQFIKYDKNSMEYIENLSFDRKVDLLDSSDSATVIASSKIYDSMSENEQEVVQEKISTSDGLSALHESSSYNESVSDTNEANSKEDDIEFINTDIIDKVEEVIEKSLEINQNEQEQLNQDSRQNNLTPNEEVQKSQNLERESINMEKQDNIELDSNNLLVEEFNKAEKIAELNELESARVILAELNELDQVKTI